MITKFSPRKKNNLVPDAGAFLRKLEIVDCVSTLLFRQVFDEFFIVLLSGRFLNHNLRKPWVEAEDDILELLPQFQLLVVVQASRVNRYTRSL